MISISYFIGAELLSGGFLLVLFFDLSDRMSAPIYGKAGLFYGLLYGMLTMYIRHKTNLDGSLIAALILSVVARPLDYFMAPLPFGGRRR